VRSRSFDRRAAFGPAHPPALHGAGGGHSRPRGGRRCSSAAGRDTATGTCAAASSNDPATWTVGARCASTCRNWCHVWERLVELAGGGDIEARVLSLWCPPAYIAGCSQGCGSTPSAPKARLSCATTTIPRRLLEGNWLATRWCGQQVLAMGDCLWGALDGMNEAGLAASLSFGGRTQTGKGFGIPLVMRYLLEVSSTVEEACDVLKRVPVHMSYSITLLDTAGHWATVFVGPDIATYVTRRRAITNFQHQVDWPAARQGNLRSRASRRPGAGRQKHSLSELSGRTAAAAAVPDQLPARLRHAVQRRVPAGKPPRRAVLARPALAAVAARAAAGERDIVFPTAPADGDQLSQFEEETDTMFTISRRFAIAATLATALMSAPALAQELTGTLKKIKEDRGHHAGASRVVDPVLVL
jgi:hypothetical protein